AQSDRRTAGDQSSCREILPRYAGRRGDGRNGGRVKIGYMAVPVTRLTIDDFEKLPDELAYYHELVDGELVDVSGNTPNHNLLRDALIAMLLPYVKEHELGKVIGEQEDQFEKDAHGPDVTFLLPDKARLLNGNLRVQRFVPDLAIEIVSENDAFKKLIRKVE